jgi:uncharacterized membrane protein/predicted enzyme related to lactoylglutathione lyase
MMNYELEVLTLPVSDVDRALAFYTRQAGFLLDVDYHPASNLRVVQMTPPGSACSIQIGVGLTDATPGSSRATYLVVADIEAAHRELTDRGVQVSAIQHKSPIDDWQGDMQAGVDPQRRDYASLANFVDPDGNTWVIQEIGYPVPGHRAPGHGRRVVVTGRSRPERDTAERDPARLVAFSDAVIAIAVTLLVLEIRPPQDTRHLFHGLAALWPSYVTYVITFMLIGQVWANHHVMFDHIRHADRAVLFLNTVLLMDMAFLPFAASVLAEAFREGQGERTAVVFHGTAFGLAAALFNVIWWYARHDRRLLANTIDSAGVRAISRRFQLALAWIGAGTLLGALLPALGVAVIAAFIVYYWLPISGEIGRARPRTDLGSAEEPPR